MMPAATVLIPTFRHAEPLRIAGASVLAQTMDDFELFIVGDGVDDATRQAALDLASSDKRVRFFDFAKAPRKGETLRDEALKSASGRIVAYLGDDDLWLPHHLETLDRLLTKVDFGHTLHVGINENGRLSARPGDLADAAFKAKMTTKFFNCFDMTFAGHTLDAYRRLDRGWETTPPDFPWIDLFLWRKFLNAPWCRSASEMVPTGICTQTHLRPHLSDDERTAEMREMLDRYSGAAGHEELWRVVTRNLARQVIKAKAKRSED